VKAQGRGLKTLAAGLLALAGAALLGAWMMETLPQSRGPEPGEEAPHGRLAFLQEGVRVEGPEQGKRDAALRRKQLLGWLSDMEAMRPKAVVIEDWMEGSSQEEARALLAPLEDSLLPLAPAKARPGLQARFDGLRQQLQLDHDLEVLFAENEDILLPLGLGPASPLLEPGPSFERASFHVALRGGEQAHLGQAASLARQPLQAFQEASAQGGVALGQSGPGLPAVFECQGRWLPSLGLAAALMQADLGRQDLHFQWRGRRLSSVELGGRSIPLDASGLCYEDPRQRALPLEALPLEPLLSGALGPARVAGKVVFFRPWPLQDGAPGMDAQERLFAGYFSGSLKEEEPKGWPRQSALRLALAVALAGAALCGWGLRGLLQKA